MNAVTFAMCIAGSVVQYRRIMRIAGLIDSFKTSDDRIMVHLLTDMLTMRKGCPGLKDDKNDEDDESRYCADYK